MTDENRAKMLDILIGSVDAEDIRELGDMSLADLAKIEVLVDDIEQQAFLRGKFEAFLEEAVRWGKFLEKSQADILTSQK